MIEEWNQRMRPICLERRFEFESRPFRVEPVPFLCAMVILGNEIDS